MRCMRAGRGWQWYDWCKKRALWQDQYTTPPTARPNFHRCCAVAIHIPIECMTAHHKMKCNAVHKFGFDDSVEAMVNVKIDNRFVSAIHIHILTIVHCANAFECLNVAASVKIDFVFEWVLMAMFIVVFLESDPENSIANVQKTEHNYSPVLPHGVFLAASLLSSDNHCQLFDWTSGVASIDLNECISFRWTF